MIQVKNLEFTYKKTQKKAIRDLNFDIQEGEIFGFLGPNGAGKTTTQRLIIRLLRNYTGNVVVLGKKRNQWGKEFYEQIVRDPIMAALMLAPLFLIAVFNVIVVLLVPFILSRTGFDAVPYMDYVFVFVVIMCGVLLGIVTGFMMIDERDGHISELMSVTPLGREGYLFNRLLFAAA